MKVTQKAETSCFNGPFKEEMISQRTDRQTDRQNPFRGAARESEPSSQGEGHRKATNVILNLPGGFIEELIVDYKKVL